MSRGPVPSLRIDQTWKCALIGGVVSIPLVLAHYWLSGMGDDFSIHMLFFGGLLAGYLAKRNAVTVRRAGLGAGLIGGVPGYVWILPAMVRTGTDFAAAWSSPAAATVVMVLFSGIIIAFSALAGFAGGIVGGWLARKVDEGQVPAVNL